MFQPIVDFILANALEVLVAVFGVVLSYGVMLLRQGLKAAPAVLVAMAVQLEAQDDDSVGADDTAGKVLRIVAQALRTAIQAEGLDKAAK